MTVLMARRGLARRSDALDPDGSRCRLPNWANEGPLTQVHFSQLGVWMSRRIERRTYRQGWFRASRGLSGAACDGGRRSSRARATRPSMRRALMTLSTVGVLVTAFVGATAPSAAAFKNVELKIHTEAPNVQHAIYPLYIEWAMRCANYGGPGGDSGATETSGTQQIRTTAFHPCNRQQLWFSFKVFAGRDIVRPYWGTKFSGFVDNPLFTGRPGITLRQDDPHGQYTIQQRTIFSDWPGWDEGEIRKGDAPLTWPRLHFEAKRDEDTARHKRFELWIWWDEGSYSK